MINLGVCNWYREAGVLNIGSDRGFWCRRYLAKSKAVRSL